MGMHLKMKSQSWDRADSIDAVSSVVAVHVDVEYGEKGKRKGIDSMEMSNELDINRRGRLRATPSLSWQ